MPPARTEVAKFEPDVSQLAIPSESDDLSKGSLRFMTMISLINISEEGFIEVMIDTERETFRAGRLRIRFNVSLEEMGLPSPLPV
jgi:hypothetical protein